MRDVDPYLRQEKSAAFVLEKNSTTQQTITLDLWGRSLPVYTNANFSIYSAQTCNARCAFCVEELRPSSRGVELLKQKQIESDDERYFARLEEVITKLEPLNPSVSMTGGEISKDPRLPRILQLLQKRNARKRTLTTNGSGLLDVREGQRVIDWIAESGVSYLNISIAHYDLERSQRLMRFREGPCRESLLEFVRVAKVSGLRIRLSCVLLKDEIDDLMGVRSYLDFAASLGIDNVIFRQLMKTDPESHLANYVVSYSDLKRVAVAPLLNQLHFDKDFSFQRQIVGYYYYVETWRYRNMDVVFEEADLAQLERNKSLVNNVIHELVFHPNANLTSTWQPEDGRLF